MLSLTLYQYPATAKFLTADEKETVIAMLKEDSQGLATHYDRKFVWQAISDYKTYVQMGIYLGLLLTVYAISLFAPTIVKELGTAHQNQAATSLTRVSRILLWSSSTSHHSYLRRRLYRHRRRYVLQVMG